MARLKLVYLVVLVSHQILCDSRSNKEEALMKLLIPMLLISMQSYNLLMTKKHYFLGCYQGTNDEESEGKKWTH